jgi:serine/threonine-protein kinase
LNGTVEGLREALAARYTIEQEIGAGGMAMVYLAEDIKHHRKVALKVLRPELAATLGAERFIREIEIAARLTHPHILPLHDSGDAGGLLYYVMPYVAGENLRQRMLRERETRGGFDPDAAVRIVREVCSALDYAHRQNIVHRDIKPENILLAEGHAVVADFGVARAISVAGGVKLTQSGFAVGTPMYMSPEQAVGSKDIDGATDIYSLAMVLYEMLVGELPKTPEARRSVFTDTPAEDRRRLTVVPQPVARALARASAEKARDRFSTAAEFAAALRPRAGRWDVTPRWLKTIAAGASAPIMILRRLVRSFKE